MQALVARPAGTDPAPKSRRCRIALVAAHARGWLGVWVAAVGVGMSCTARADERPEPPVALAWQATGADCASVDQIRERVTRLTERSVVLVREAQSYAIRVTVSEQDSNWQAVVSLHDPAGTLLGSRDVRARSPSCRTLDVPVALVIATMADGLPKASPLEKSNDLEADRAGASVGFGAFAAGSAGLSESVGLGMGLELEVAWKLPAAIEASVYAPREHLDDFGRGARVWSFHAGPRVCPNLFVGGEVALRMCGTVQAGAEHAEGIGLTESQSALRPIAFMGLGPSLLLGDPAGFSAQFAVSAAWVFVRARFHWDIEEEEQSLEGTEFAVLARIGVIGFVP